MTLSSVPSRRGLAAACLLPWLVACGGGGSAGAEVQERQAVAPPTSGTYTWVLKAQGSTAALTYGLSLLHPSTPEVEFVVESGSSFVTDGQGTA